MTTNKILVGLPIDTVNRVKIPQQPNAEKLKRQCYQWLLEFGQTFNQVMMQTGMEYEPALDKCLQRHGLAEHERISVGGTALALAKLYPLPYHKLSPRNQFRVGGWAYVLYCLRNKVSDPSMQTEAEALLCADASLLQFLDDYCRQVESEVGGALGCWNSGYTILVVVALIAVGIYLMMSRLS